MHAIALALLALTQSPAAAAGQQAVAITDPVALFNSVCAGTQGSLSRKDYATVPYAELPRPAREIFGFGLHGGYIHVPPFALKDAQVPNQVLVQLQKKHVYLILPAPGDASGDAAPVCAVIWRGDHFREAVTAVTALTGDNDQDRLSTGPLLPGHSRVMLFGRHARAGAAFLDGWTILHAAPDTSKPAP